MKYYIGLEDLAANALIAVMKRQDKRFVSFEDLEKYGVYVYP